MSISVRNLHKNYGRHEALKGISFEAKSGRILGFLGPNGAGKSTTMKILAGNIAASSGEAYVCGLPINGNNAVIRQRIGYLPENNPLYKDMYVMEFLGFMAGIHKLSRPLQRINEVVALTGLVPEQHKKITQLSKGYRQRIGIAQAILHDPEVLILDEPTSGLDPNQLQEIRALIKNLGREKTVLLSTHIMQEVEAICDDVVIINQGKLVADFALKDLAATYQENSLEQLFSRVILLQVNRFQ